MSKIILIALLLAVVGCQENQSSEQPVQIVDDFDIQLCNDQGGSVEIVNEALVCEYKPVKPVLCKPHPDHECPLPGSKP